MRFWKAGVDQIAARLEISTCLGWSAKPVIVESLDQIYRRGIDLAH